MVVGIIPVVGMPLPFISKGGSSLLSFYIAFGIIISMATHKKLMQKWKRPIFVTNYLLFRFINMKNKKNF